MSQTATILPKCAVCCVSPFPFPPTPMQAMFSTSFGPTPPAHPCRPLAKTPNPATEAPYRNDRRLVDGSWRSSPRYRSSVQLRPDIPSMIRWANRTAAFSEASSPHPTYRRVMKIPACLPGVTQAVTIQDPQGDRWLPRTMDAKNGDYLAAHHKQCTVGAALPDSKQEVPQLLANERILVSQPTRKWKRFQAGESFVELGRQSSGRVGRALGEPAQDLVKVAVGRLGDLDPKAHDNSGSLCFRRSSAIASRAGASSTGVHVFQALPDRREGFLSLLIR